MELKEGLQSLVIALLFAGVALLAYGKSSYRTPESRAYSNYAATAVAAIGFALAFFVFR